MYYPKGQTKVIAVRLLLVVNHLAFMRAVVVVTMVLFRSVVIADIAQKQHDHRALIFCPCWCFHQQHKFDTTCANNKQLSHDTGMLTFPVNRRS